MSEANRSILLVSCYELGHQPLSLASPLGAFERVGLQARAVDSAVQALTDEAIGSARVVAFAVPMHTALRLAEPLAERVRHLNPSAHLNFYGLYAWLNADYLFGSHLADSVIGGEYEAPLVDLARWLQTSDSESTRPEGVRFPDRFSPPHLGRQTYPVPDRSQLPGLEHYSGLQRGETVLPAGYVETTRGCKHVCAHCPITPVYGGRFFAVPQNVVMADVQQQVEAGAKHITFGDPDFLNGPTHSLRIAREMHAAFPDLTFDATIKVEHILQHANLFPELHELGCAFVVSAFESVSDEVLTHLNKGHTSADIGRALDIMAEACIPLRPSLVPFAPWSGLDDYLALLRFVRARKLTEDVDPVQYTIRLLVPPGSALLQDPDAGDWIGEFDPGAYTYRWQHPDPRMDELHASVMDIVRQAELEGRPARDVFRDIERAAFEAAGMRLPNSPQPAHAVNGHPRLTESWFC